MKEDKVNTLVVKRQYDYREKTMECLADNCVKMLTVEPNIKYHKKLYQSI